MLQTGEQLHLSGRARVSLDSQASGLIQPSMTLTRYELTVEPQEPGGGFRFVDAVGNAGLMRINGMHRLDERAAYAPTNGHFSFDSVFFDLGTGMALPFLTTPEVDTSYSSLETPRAGWLVVTDWYGSIGGWKVDLTPLFTLHRGPIDGGIDESVTLTGDDRFLPQPWPHDASMSCATAPLWPMVP